MAIHLRIFRDKQMLCSDSVIAIFQKHSPETANKNQHDSLYYNKVNLHNSTSNMDICLGL